MFFVYMSLIEWLYLHRYHDIETFLKKEDNIEMRFFHCKLCQTYYYDGEIYEM